VCAVGGVVGVPYEPSNIMPNALFMWIIHTDFYVAPRMLLVAVIIATDKESY